MNSVLAPAFEMNHSDFILTNHQGDITYAYILGITHKTIKLGDLA